MYRGLDFGFADLQRELVNLQLLAKEFLAPVSRQRLTDWSLALEEFRASRSTGDWAWKTCAPIETVTAKEYERGGRHCNFFARGEMSTVWVIRLSQRNNPRNFRLVGNASTVLRIIGNPADEQPKLLAQWQIEVGGADSPGCHFHVGVGQYDEAPLFPHGLSVPRLPSFLVTPTDALDFLLGELFQDRWASKVGEDSDAARGFGNPQKKRMLKLLNWKSDVVRQSAGSAWNHLKRTRPLDPNLFVTD